PIIQKLAALGYGLFATEGTAAMLTKLGLPVRMTTKKLNMGHPNVLDVVQGGMVQGVVNTVSGGRSTMKDGFFIRRAATERGLPVFTSLDTFGAAVESLASGDHEYSVLPLQEYLTR
ncbi:MAG TPA: hypothetical protein VIK32_14410, partial [Candidatus Limnocylindrales bacterium]